MPRRFFSSWGGALLVVLCLVGHAGAQEAVSFYGEERIGRQLLIRSTTDISIFGPVLEAFAAETPGVFVRYEQWGSNELFRQTLKACREEGAVADVVISSGVHQMVKLVNDACAQSYRSSRTEALPEDLRWRNELWGITREPAVIVYNKELVDQQDIPKTRFDLLDLLRPSRNRFTGRVATYDIEASGLGYLFAFADSLEATTFGALQESFSRTGAISTCCSTDIIRAVAEGQYLMAYNVLGSYAQGYQQTDDRIGITLPSDYTLVLSRAMMIPKGTTHFGEATALLEYLLSNDGVIALRKSLLISPLFDGENETGEGLPSTAQRTIGLSPALLVSLDAQTRKAFLQRWRSTFPAP
ncbi:ABC transporter substrate-binding protein [Roseibium sp.]|uniref:ABC transporter substrate-binding protein n=1 Tax=Roseibium sp. TaxID=1936156 RepID=UPI003A988648